MTVLGPPQAARAAPLAWSRTPRWAELAVAGRFGGAMRVRGVQPVLWPPGLRSTGRGRPPCLLAAPEAAAAPGGCGPAGAPPPDRAPDGGADADAAGDNEWRAGGK
eukprot:5595546-Alexandrium_andersonii.AAC.1